jgi:prepilin-type N-terminal cleavage/methylation domain-containing protein
VRGPVCRQLLCGDRGFTMIELVIVMMIIAIAFFAVRPAVTRPLQANRERAGVRRVMSALVAARGRAVGEGRLVRVIVSPGDGALWADIQADPWTDRAAFTPLLLLGRRETVLPEELTIARLAIGGGTGGQADESAIYFYPDGRTSGAQLILEGATGQEFFVELLAATGRVRLVT